MQSARTGLPYRMQERKSVVQSAHTGLPYRMQERNSVVQSAHTGLPYLTTITGSLLVEGEDPTGTLCRELQT